MDLSQEQSGPLEPGSYFSDLYAQFIRAEFTGSVHLWDEDNDREGTIQFVRGKPCHVAGDPFTDHLLGEVLTKLGTVREEDVDFALCVQETEEDKPLLGQLLIRQAYVEEDAIEFALAVQTKHRVSAAFAIEAGLWRTTPADDDSVTKGHPIEGLGILASALRVHASADELRDFSDDLLGSSVKLTCDLEDAAGYGCEDSDRALLRLLAKPRKPSHLEKSAGDRRQVRALLKALSLAGVLERLPDKKGIPIPGVRRTRITGARVSRPPTEPPPEPPEPEVDDAEVRILAAEIRGRAKAAESQNHFQLLGVKETATDELLRAQYTELVRTYHPDLLAQRGLNQEVLDIAAELASRLNDAYQTLGDPAQREEYERLCADERVKGDARKKALLDDAERKFKIAQVYLKKKDRAKAQALFRQAVDQAPTDGRFRAYLAWSLWLDKAKDKDEIAAEVIALLVEAVQAAPDEADAHYFLGSVVKVVGDIEQAKGHFERAVEIDPNKTEAYSELRLIQRRNKNL